MKQINPLTAPNKYGMKSVTIGNATLICGDSNEVLKTLSDIDNIVCDPPYGLDFMGKAWDSDVPTADLWNLAYNCLKPGGHLLAFSGARTYHRLACAVEDAGFDIRDQLLWLFGTGFPKSRNIGQDVDRIMGHEREVVGAHNRIGFNKLKLAHGVQKFSTLDFKRRSDVPITSEAEDWSGWGTALKPAHEPIVMARKPFRGSCAANVLKHGTGALNIDACRVEGGRHPANVILDGSDVVVDLFPMTRTGRGSKHQRGSNSIYADRGTDQTGELSANGGDHGSAARYFYCAKASVAERDEGLEDFERKSAAWFQTSGGTSGKSSMKGEAQARANTHPTVKPTALMEHLCKLVAAPGSVILDPFMGSGSTGKAAVRNGFKFIGIERDPAYFEIACARIQAAMERTEYE